MIRISAICSRTIQRILLICRAKAFIDNAIQGGGRVLVHCNGTRSHLCLTLSVAVKRPFNERGVFVIIIKPPTAHRSIPVVMLQLTHVPLPLCFDTYPRRNIVFSSIRDHVRHATFPDLVGRCSALCSESQVLHLPQQWFHHSDQGSPFNSSSHSSRGRIPSGRVRAYREVRPLTPMVSFGCCLCRNTNRYTKPALRSHSILPHRSIGRPRGGSAN